VYLLIRLTVMSMRPEKSPVITIICCFPLATGYVSRNFHASEVVANPIDSISGSF